MKNVYLITLCFYSITSALSWADDATHLAKEKAESRTTARFGEYDAVISKLEAWSKEKPQAKRTEEIKEDAVRVSLTKEDLERSVTFLKRVKWYREQLEDNCSASDASAKALGERIDACFSKGIISEAVDQAKKLEGHYELSLSLAALNSCKFDLNEYFATKRALFNEEARKAYAIDWEMDAKMSELFGVFGHATEPKKLEGPSAKMADLLKETKKANLCLIEVPLEAKKESVKETAKKPAKEASKEASKEDAKKAQPVQPGQPVSPGKRDANGNCIGTPCPEGPKYGGKAAYTSPGNGYTPPANGYTPPANGYTPPANGYTPPTNGYKYDAGTAYDRKKFNYDPNYDEPSYGGNPLAYLPNMNYQKPDNYQPHSQPMQYFPPPPPSSGPINTGPVYPPPQVRPQPYYPVMPVMPPPPPPSASFSIGISSGPSYSSGSGGGSYQATVAVRIETPISMPFPMPLQKQVCQKRLMGKPCSPTPNLLGPNRFPGSPMPYPNMGMGFPMGQFNPYMPIPYQNINPSRPPTYSPVTQSVPVDPIRYRIPRGVKRR